MRVNIGAAIFFGGLALAPRGDRLIVFILAALPTLAVVLGARWQYRDSVLVWSQRLSLRAAALPPTGTPIIVDAEGVRIGREKIDWSRLTPERLELIERSNENEAVLTVDRIVATDGERSFAFDRGLMRRGGEIVDAAFLKLVRESASVEPARADSIRAPQSAFSAARPA